MTWRALFLACIGLLPSVAAADSAAGAQTGLQNDVAFTQYADISSSAELMRRLVSPLNARRVQQRASATGAAIREQPVDLAQERFALYVPDHAPPDGYALLVFVPPWNEATVPPAWIPVLERHGVLLVTAGKSGNDTNVLDRREPLALLAATNAMARYRVDARKVYIGGFSGGSRVALRLALGYPDLFHGALLEAGSDIVGKEIPPPPRELLYEFQTSSRVVYLTGGRDASRQDADRQSRHSLNSWCITDVDTRTMPWTGHELADAASLGRALMSLDTHSPGDMGELAACRARIDHEINEQLDKVKALIDSGKKDEARRLLESVDAQYGGLAGPRIMSLAKDLGT